jgi:hypothetical protein
MKEFDDLMEALKQLARYDVDSAHGFKKIVIDTYLAFKAAPEPLVLEQDTSLNFQRMPKLFINSDGIYCLFHNENVYKLPEKK